MKIRITALIICLMLLLCGCRSAGNTDVSSVSEEVSDVQVSSEIPPQSEPETSVEESSEEPVAASTPAVTSKPPAPTSAPVANIPQLTAEQLQWINSFDNTSAGYGWKYDEARQNIWSQFDAYTIGDRSRPVVYLTFDCGYEYNNLTDSILDILSSRGVKAVFFVTMSYVKSHPEKVSRMIAEGHAVGNHTVNHPDMPSQSLEKAYSEIAELHDYMIANFGYEMHFFRFPSGVSSNRTRALVKAAGYKSVFWTFGYGDWNTAQQPEPQTGKQLIMDNLQNGTIYLLHAVSQTNVTILGEVIDNIRAAGYSIELFS